MKPKLYNEGSTDRDDRTAPEGISGFHTEVNAAPKAVGRTSIIRMESTHSPAVITPDAAYSGTTLGNGPPEGANDLDAASTSYIGAPTGFVADTGATSCHVYAVDASMVKDPASDNISICDTSRGSQGKRTCGRCSLNGNDTKSGRTATHARTHSDPLGSRRVQFVVTTPHVYALKKTAKKTGDQAMLAYLNGEPPRYGWSPPAATLGEPAVHMHGEDGHPPPYEPPEQVHQPVITDNKYSMVSARPTSPLDIVVESKGSSSTSCSGLVHRGPATGERSEAPVP
ncbi:hypothetical protein CALCODRAFT_507257 [Calocera cornea HHB12733]|uniref:Uncharacterized protein n=1 Tax=Calocera cornea HHB12733 TaxID=1353952 RepID=A0A165HYD9_9BASI|nr:hypothetical protein CALCODRAFT_507257 [Calocera cornea HHB12733]